MDAWLFRVWDIRLLWMFLYRFCMGIWGLCLLFFIFLPYLPACWYPIASALFETKTFFLPLNCLCKVSCPYMCVCISEFSFFIPLIRFYLFMSMPLSVTELYKRLEIGQCKSSCFSNCVDCFRSFAFPCESWNQFIHFDTQKPAENLTECCADSVQQLGENWYR